VQAKQASTLVIVGAGGHGRVVADAAVCAGRWTRIVATERSASPRTGQLLPGVELVPLDVALALPDAQFHVAIGANDVREREALALGARELATVIHPAASVSAQAQVEAGCFVAAQSVLAPGARLGIGVIVNHGAVIDHDVRLGAFSHVAPRAGLGGKASLGARVLLGTGANVLPGLAVCDGAVVGAGAAVCATIDVAGTYAGVPARRIR
jgi:sugar O-acyltransferase (sialic acid O-acetyltransferase NeuD family)